MMRYEPGEVESMNMNSLRSDIERIENKLKVEHRAALAAKDARISELEGMLTKALAFTEANTFGGTDALALIEECHTAIAGQQQQQPGPATHSEDGREVPEVVGSLIEGEFFHCVQNGPGNNPLMTVAQHERIVAGLQAELATERQHVQDQHAAWTVCDAERQHLRAQPARQVGGDGRVRRVLLLTSYCGDDSEGCTDATPCAECLKMCNVALTSGDMKVIGVFGSQAALAPATVVMPVRKVLPNYTLHPLLYCEITGWNDCLDELGRIVAAKDAEIARLRELHENAHSAAKTLMAERATLMEQAAHFLEAHSSGPSIEQQIADELRAEAEQLRAQPARQVGGGEMEAYLSYVKLHTDWLIGTSTENGWSFIDADTEQGWRIWQARAALAPAAVVMPGRKEVPAPNSWMRQGWAKGWNSACDEFSRLNRRAIPEGLLERVCAIAECEGQPEGDELRALLGKES